MARKTAAQRREEEMRKWEQERQRRLEEERLAQERQARYQTQLEQNLLVSKADAQWKLASENFLASDLPVPVTTLAAYTPEQLAQAQAIIAQTKCDAENEISDWENPHKTIAIHDKRSLAISHQLEILALDQVHQGQVNQGQINQGQANQGQVNQGQVNEQANQTQANSENSAAAKTTASKKSAAKTPRAKAASTKSADSVILSAPTTLSGKDDHLAPWLASPYRDLNKFSDSNKAQELTSYLQPEEEAAAQVFAQQRLQRKLLRPLLQHQLVEEVVAKKPAQIMAPTELAHLLPLLAQALAEANAPAQLCAYVTDPQGLAQVLQSFSAEHKQRLATLTGGNDTKALAKFRSTLAKAQDKRVKDILKQATVKKAANEQLDQNDYELAFTGQLEPYRKSFTADENPLAQLAPEIPLPRLLLKQQPADYAETFANLPLFVKEVSRLSNSRNKTQAEAVSNKDVSNKDISNKDVSNLERFGYNQILPQTALSSYALEYAEAYLKRLKKGQELIPLNLANLYQHSFEHYSLLRQGYRADITQLNLNYGQELPNLPFRLKQLDVTAQPSYQAKLSQPGLYFVTEDNRSIGLVYGQTPETTNILVRDDTYARKVEVPQEWQETYAAAKKLRLIPLNVYQLQDLGGYKYSLWFPDLAQSLRQLSSNHLMVQLAKANLSNLLAAVLPEYHVDAQVEDALSKAAQEANEQAAQERNKKAAPAGQDSANPTYTQAIITTTSGVEAKVSRVHGEDFRPTLDTRRNIDGSISYFENLHYVSEPKYYQWRKSLVRPDDLFNWDLFAASLTRLLEEFYTAEKEPTTGVRNRRKKVIDKLICLGQIDVADIEFPKYKLLNPVCHAHWISKNKEYYRSYDHDYDDGFYIHKEYVYDEDERYHSTPDGYHDYIQVFSANEYSQEFQAELQDFYQRVLKAVWAKHSLLRLDPFVRAWQFAEDLALLADPDLSMLNRNCPVRKLDLVALDLLAGNFARIEEMLEAVSYHSNNDLDENYKFSQFYKDYKSLRDDYTDSACAAMAPVAYQLYALTQLALMHYWLNTEPTLAAEAKTESTATEDKAKATTKAAKASAKAAKDAKADTKATKGADKPAHSEPLDLPTSAQGLVSHFKPCAFVFEPSLTSASFVYDATIVEPALALCRNLEVPTIALEHLGLTGLPLASYRLSHPVDYVLLTVDNCPVTEPTVPTAQSNTDPKTDTQSNTQANVKVKVLSDSQAEVTVELPETQITQRKKSNAEWEQHHKQMLQNLPPWYRRDSEPEKEPTKEELAQKDKDETAIATAQVRSSLLTDKLEQEHKAAKERTNLHRDFHIVLSKNSTPALEPLLQALKVTQARKTFAEDRWAKASWFDWLTAQPESACLGALQQVSLNLEQQAIAHSSYRHERAYTSVTNFPTKSTAELLERAEKLALPVLGFNNLEFAKFPGYDSLRKLEYYMLNSDQYLKPSYRLGEFAHALAKVLADFTLVEQEVVDEQTFTWHVADRINPTYTGEINQIRELKQLQLDLGKYYFEFDAKDDDDDDDDYYYGYRSEPKAKPAHQDLESFYEQIRYKLEHLNTNSLLKLAIHSWVFSIKSISVNPNYLRINFRQRVYSVEEDSLQDNLLLQATEDSLTIFPPRSLLQNPQLSWVDVQANPTALEPLSERCFNFLQAGRNCNLDCTQVPLEVQADNQLLTHQRVGSFLAQQALPAYNSKASGQAPKQELTEWLQKLHANHKPSLLWLDNYYSQEALARWALDKFNTVCFDQKSSQPVWELEQSLYTYQEFQEEAWAANLVKLGKTAQKAKDTYLSQVQKLLTSLAYQPGAQATKTTSSGTSASKKAAGTGASTKTASSVRTYAQLSAGLPARKKATAAKFRLRSGTSTERKRLTKDVSTWFKDHCQLLHPFTSINPEWGVSTDLFHGYYYQAFFAEIQDYDMTNKYAYVREKHALPDAREPILLTAGSRTRMIYPLVQPSLDDLLARLLSFLVNPRFYLNDIGGLFGYSFLKNIKTESELAEEAEEERRRRNSWW